MKHMMIDLETWGTKPGAAIRSIGAVEFNPYKVYDTGKEFYRNIDLDSQLKLGLIQDHNTVKWWDAQDAAAQEALLPDQRDCTEVVDDFIEFYKSSTAKYIWSQGSNFDGVLWEALSLACGRDLPWAFYNTRDTRTIYQIAKVNTKKIKRLGQAHNALDDSKHQVVCVQAGFARVGWLDFN